MVLVGEGFVYLDGSGLNVCNFAGVPRVLKLFKGLVECGEECIIDGLV